VPTPSTSQTSSVKPSTSESLNGTEQASPTKQPGS
jgi:hypothetical protein